MYKYLKELEKFADVGLVGGSDLAKIAEQMGGYESLSLLSTDWLF